LVGKANKNEEIDHAITDKKDEEVERWIHCKNGKFDICCR
jgi:hypothetical protein